MSSFEGVYFPLYSPFILLLRYTFGMGKWAHRHGHGQARKAVQPGRECEQQL